MMKNIGILGLSSFQSAVLPYLFQATYLLPSALETELIQNGLLFSFPTFFWDAVFSGF